MARRTVIVGGGVIGTSIAWHLARKGAGDVTLLERDRLGSGTTWHSAGNITWKPLRDHDAPVDYALACQAELQNLLGHDSGWLTTGRTFLALGEETRRDFEAFDRAARARGLAARWLEPAEARGLNPLLAGEGIEAIWLNPRGGRLNPADLTANYAAAARRAGARILEHTPVAGLEMAGGRVRGVRTNVGLVEADTVVVAAGLWSRALLTPLGIELAQWPCEHFYLIAEAGPRLPRTMPSFVAPDLLTYGREEVGHLLIGFFDENALPLDPAGLPEPFTFTLLEPLFDKAAPYIDGATRLFPSLATAPIRRFVNGPETFTPDALPLIGPVAGLEGLIVATAMSSVGVTWSAMVGDLVSDLAMGATPRFAHDHYDPQRFGDRSGDLDWLKAQVSGAVSGGYRRQNR